MRHWSGADTPTDISSPLSTPGSTSSESTPTFLRKAKFLDTQRDDEEARAIGSHAQLLVERAAAADDKPALAACYRSLLTRARTEPCAAKGNQPQPTPPETTDVSAPSAPLAPPAPAAPLLEWLGNELVELNSGQRLAADATTGQWTFKRGDRLRETMRFGARAVPIRRLRYEVFTYKRMFGRFVLVHRASPVLMGDYPARDEPYEFECPLQVVPHGPKAFLCGLNRTIICFSCEDGPLLEREVIAELK